MSKVSKTLTLDVETIIRVGKIVETESQYTFSSFVQMCVNEELKKRGYQ